MKKAFLSIAISLVAMSSFAQWTTDGNNVTIDKNIGIGTTTPTVKLDVNGDAKVNVLHLNTLNPGENYRVSKISYLGHSLRVGSAAGSYAHNSFDLMAGGAVQGTVHTAMGMYITPKIGEYIRKVLIHSSGNSYFNGGNVGIGTDNPTVKLDINGDAKVNVLHLNTLNPGENYRVSKISYLGHSLRVGSAAGSYAHNSFDLMAEGAVQGTVHTAMGMYITPKIGEYIRKVLIHSSGNSYFNGGNVGIGTDNPIHKLDVNGVIRAKEIKVEADWADFVFDKDYKLPSLLEVEAHINEYKHLPDIPSEKQVKEEGVNIGEMQAKLLQKIEELTLYVIEQDKTINEQNRRMNELEKKVNNQ